MFDAIERYRSRKYPKPVLTLTADAPGYLGPEIQHFHNVNKEALMSNRTPEADESFGKGFNLILAVSEQGPARIKEINARVTALDFERNELMQEADILTRLVAVVQK